MTSAIIPCLRYRDAPGMIDWLCKAFGFERHAAMRTARAASPMPSLPWAAA